jgi:hypothetical protein
VRYEWGVRKLLPLLCGALVVACGARSSSLESEPESDGERARTVEAKDEPGSDGESASPNRDDAPDERDSQPGDVGEAEDNDAPPVSVTSPATGFTPGATTPVPATTVPATPVPTTPVPTTTMPAATETGTAPTNVMPTAPATNVTPPGTAEPPREVPDCSNTDTQGFEGAELGAFPGATYVFSYSDATSSSCPEPSLHCLAVSGAGAQFFGVAAAAQSDYACWGAGLGIQMALADDLGSVLEPWDAASLGVTAVRFNVSGVTGGPKLRVQLSVVGLPDDALYAHGGGTADVGIDGEYVLAFADFRLPVWVLDAHPDLEGVPLDLSKLQTLALQVTTLPASSMPFDFSLHDLQWLDATLTPVMVPTPTPPAVSDAGVAPSDGQDDEPGDEAAASGGASPLLPE